jgi:DNA-binding transcriptional ArsR family regulator
VAGGDEPGAVDDRGALHPGDAGFVHIDDLDALGCGAHRDAAQSASAALGALLGPARAAVLVLLDSPHSTTQLTAVTGQTLGSVGRHLRVLLDAGLVERRRAGRSVLYSRSAAGEVLVTASGAGAGPDTYRS